MALACVNQLIDLVTNHVSALTGATGLGVRLTGDGEGVTSGTWGSSDDRLCQEVGGKHDRGGGRGAGVVRGSGSRAPQEM